MKNLILHGVLAGLILSLPSAPRSAAQETDSVMPRVENAQFEKRSLTVPLPAELQKWAAQAAQPQWLGYGVPRIAGDRSVCCGSDNGSWTGACAHCRLERGERNSEIISNNGSATARLEGPRYLLVLIRAENKRVGKIRIASEECALDAGGLPFLWLTGVHPPESVAVLQTFVTNYDAGGKDDERIAQGALTAIAMHADAAAGKAMESFVQPSQSESLRKHAAFWLGEARGAEGLRALQTMAKTDPSSEVRAQVTFALSVSREPGALEEMIRMAHSDESSHVRGQALFWLAQKAGQKAVGAITGAIENDPDTDVKKKAVFALSQLPKDEGVPKLIEVAQTNRNREVRKQAIFWLGQSNDPRALAFFEQILSR